MPPVAMVYYNSHLKTRQPPVAVRNLRELATLSTILDHLANGRADSAADVAAQRMKAVVQAVNDGHWNNANYAELVEEDSGSLMNHAETMFLKRERRLREDLNQDDPPYWGNFVKGKGSKAWKSNPTWVNPSPQSEAKGKTKFNKGVGKGCGKAKGWKSYNKGKKGPGLPAEDQVADVDHPAQG